MRLGQTKLFHPPLDGSLLTQQLVRHVALTQLEKKQPHTGPELPSTITQPRVDQKVAELLISMPRCLMQACAPPLPLPPVRSRYHYSQFSAPISRPHKLDLDPDLQN